MLAILWFLTFALLSLTGTFSVEVSVAKSYTSLSSVDKNNLKILTRITRIWLQGWISGSCEFYFFHQMEKVYFYEKTFLLWFVAFGVINWEVKESGNDQKSMKWLFVAFVKFTWQLHETEYFNFLVLETGSALFLFLRTELIITGHNSKTINFLWKKCSFNIFTNFILMNNKCDVFTPDMWCAHKNLCVLY